MEISFNQKVKQNVKTLKLHMKVCDLFECTFEDEAGKQVGPDYEGYVPSFMPGEHYGDYLILDVDLVTGQILNWKAPTAKVQEFFDEHMSDEE